MSTKANGMTAPAPETEIWRQYEQGVDYKTRIGLYRTVDLNERFYAGDQWVGVPHEGLPTPVVNFIKYASAWKIAAVTERRLKMQFFADGLSDGGDIGIYAKQISAYCDMLWERLGMDYITKEGLKQAAITGDYVQYFYWDSGLATGQAVTGDIATQLIDSVNFYPGNPNAPDVQSQPYIILAFREMVSKVREEARRNGCENADEIAADEETEYTAGDRGKVEMDGSGKCNVLLRMYRKDGRVWCEKATRSAMVQPAKDTKLMRYPVALMNWETRKNCCHGVAEVTGLIPNQVYVNKILALSQLSQMQMSFPKVIYDRTRIREWTNRVAGVIPVNGDIGGAAQYLTPPGASYDAWRGLDATLDKTMRMMGANDVTLGSIKNPDNTSAFIAARDAAMVPLQSHQERFYAFIEDTGLIWLDFIRSFYKGGRMIPVVKDGQRVFVPLPEDALGEYAMRLKVEVGPSTMWSEIQVLQTLDNLLKGGKITLKQYLERLPDGHIPMKQELLDEAARAEQSGQGAQQPSSGAARHLPPGAPEKPQAFWGGQPGKGMGGAQGMGGMMQAQAGAGVGTTGGSGAPPLQRTGHMAAQMSAEGVMPGQGAMGGQPGSGQLAAMLKLVQAGVQSGDVKPEAAQAIGKLAQDGAGMEEIVKAIKDAAARGLVSRKLIAVLAQAGAGKPGVQRTPLQGVGMAGVQRTPLQGVGMAGVQRTPLQGAGMAGVKSTPLQDAGMAGAQSTTQMGAGMNPAMANTGNTAGDPPNRSPQGIGNTAGKPSTGAGMPGVGAKTGAKRASKRAAAQETNMKRKAEMAMGIEQNGIADSAAQMGADMQPAGGAQDGRAMLAALMELLKEGVQSGDADADVPEAIGRMISSGADAVAVTEALRQAVDAGKVSPMLLVKAEKLLGGAGMEEMTDRNMILRHNRNQLTR